MVQWQRPTSAVGIGYCGNLERQKAVMAAIVSTTITPGVTEQDQARAMQDMIALDKASRLFN
jgi:hypothetical protein